MKKAVFAMMVLAGLGFLAYSQGMLDRVIGKEGVAQGTEAKPSAGAKALYESGDFTGAADLLEAKREKGAITAEEMVLLAHTYRDLGKHDCEATAWKNILDTNPENSLAAQAKRGLGTAVRAEGREDEAAAHFHEAVQSHPYTDAGWRSGKDLGDMLLAKGDLDGARKAYSAAMLGAPTADREVLKAKVSELNNRLLSGESTSEDIGFYQVQPGNSLARIARSQSTSVGLIRLINNLSGNLIRPGQHLRIWKGTIRLDVVKSEFRLSVYIGGGWFADYQVGIGKNNSTPEGEFEIVNKIMNPPWHWQGRVIPPEDPENILGTRWMGFKNRPGLSGFGIHGTRFPESVPGAVSRGCLRMRNEEVEQLFELIPRGTIVHIRG